MQKDKKTLERRRNYIKKAMNTRHKSESVAMCASRLAIELFLSESTIWKEYAK